MEDPHSGVPAPDRAAALASLPMPPADWLRHLSLAAAELVQHLAPLLHALGAAGRPAPGAEDRAPADPMARALWLRHRRHTGPPPRRRIPRRIDAHLPRTATCRDARADHRRTRR